MEKSVVFAVTVTESASESVVGGARVLSLCTRGRRQYVVVLSMRFDKDNVQRGKNALNVTSTRIQPQASQNYLSVGNSYMSFATYEYSSSMQYY